jgi:hypothetical protein
MPVEEGCGLYDDQGLAPVEPVGKPRQGQTRGIGRTLGFDLTLLIQRELFPQEKIFRRKRWGWTQAQMQEAHGISQQPEQGRDHRPKLVELAGASRHNQNIPLQQQ